MFKPSEDDQYESYVRYPSFYSCNSFVLCSGTSAGIRRLRNLGALERNRGRSISTGSVSPRASSLAKGTCRGEKVWVAEQTAGNHLFQSSNGCNLAGAS